MTLRITLDDGAFAPTRAHDDDAGLDLYAREDAVIPAGGSYTFDTGVHVELPRVGMYARQRGFKGGYEVSELDTETVPTCWELDIETFPTAGIIKSKSGLNINHNITSDGLIDKGYTGSIAVKLYNHGSEDYEVKRGDKISQLVIVPVLTPTVEVVAKLTDTARGNNGFGSTGK